MIVEGKLLVDLEKAEIVKQTTDWKNALCVQWNGVNKGGYSFVVHLDKKHYDRRLWMLRGIPCPHAICAYYYLNQDPDQHVEHWYKKITFLKTYNHFIQPIPSIRMWPETTNPSIEPPKLRKMQADLARREERVRMRQKNMVTFQKE
ncbi:hypothetical protein H5410_040005 [Solanum commersonii]|uniref:Zinc finger PMZ-type domain-containing protein n=1 Tax=Solanum commersonii TaxID=4109 RepID=A0A9J5XML5_SOLCO|nr:hypothetical protein H5410_040005 [Solanum commersonii]